MRYCWDPIVRKEGNGPHPLHMEGGSTQVERGVLRTCKSRHELKERKKKTSITCIIHTVIFPLW